LVLTWSAGWSAIRVAVVPDLVRVRPSDAPGSVRKAVLSAARNEYAPFQIAIHGGSAGLHRVNAAAGELRGKGGRTIAAHQITLYREHYVEVKTPSPHSKEGPGWYPDALLPLAEHKPGARFTAAPFEVAVNANQVLWVDVLVPRDAAPGVYSGSITISAERQKAARVPVELTVRDFALPETPSLRSNFGGLRPAYYGLTPGAPELIPYHRQLAEAMFAHRLCAPVPEHLYPRVNADGSIDPSGTHAALKEWVERFHVTGIPIRLLGRDPLGADRERNTRYLREIYRYLRDNGWDKLAYIYVLDEPNTTEAYETVRLRARFIHETQPGIQVMCTEQPTPQDPAWGTLVGSVDLWVPIFFLFNEKDVMARVAAGEELWSYTALVQQFEKGATPYWQLDFPLLNYRVPTWIGWRYGMTGLLYWSAMVWDKAIDMWTDPLTFRKRYNLEGLLFYPGTDAGMDGFLPSMRVKQVRGSVQDYEYFRLAAAKDKAAADKVITSIGRDWRDWDTDPAHLYAARERLARIITGGK